MIIIIMMMMMKCPSVTFIGGVRTVLIRAGLISVAGFGYIVMEYSQGKLSSGDCWSSTGTLQRQIWSLPNFSNMFPLGGVIRGPYFGHCYRWALQGTPTQLFIRERRQVIWALSRALHCSRPPHVPINVTIRSTHYGIIWGGNGTDSLQLSHGQHSCWT